MFELSPLVTAASGAGLLDAGLRQVVPVEAEADDRLAREAGGQPPEGARRSCRSRPRCARLLERAGQLAARPGRTRPRRRAPAASPTDDAGCYVGVPRPGAHPSGRGMLARESARSAVREPLARCRRRLKRILVGRPLAASEQEHQRLDEDVALAVFSSDAISSTAYATEEILFVTAVAGGRASRSALDDLVPIAIVRRRSCWRSSSLATARRSTPTRAAAASYVVSRENLGDAAVAGRGGVAPRRLHPHRGGVGVGRRRRHHLGRSSTAASSTACRSAWPHRADHLANLRGIKESGQRLRHPDLRLHRRRSALLIVCGLTTIYFGDLGPCRPTRRRSTSSPTAASALAGASACSCSCGPSRPARWR